MAFSSPNDVLTNIWGYANFRPLQAEVIQSVLKKDDTLTIMPTGGGKSLCFQVPALCMEGMCLVITPIIALMKDQVEQLKQKGIKAAAVHAGLSNQEIDIILDNAVHDALQFLYISPERLKSELFLERAKRMKISLLAVDEAHCISQWGYDFRPSYLEIHNFRQYIPGTTIIALTATATSEVRKDILEKLGMREGYKVFIQSFARPELAYFVRKVEDKEAKMVEILGKVKGQGIIYVRTRKSAKAIAEYLIRKDFTADFYHGGLSHHDRNTKQDAWMNNKFRIMVATNAFGMGIDKPDVRIVIHMDLPDNLESYYQEAGRAGRDRIRSYAVLLYHELDRVELLERVKSSYPKPETLRKIYQSLANYYMIAVGSSLLTSYDFDIADFFNNYGLDYLETFHALKKLEEQGFIQLTESFYQPSKVKILLDHLELYKFEIANAAYEPVIKALLRIYGGGLYSDFQTVSEKKIAVFMRSTVAEVAKKLAGLHGQNVIFYDKKKDSPQITFTTPRYDAGKLPLDVKHLEERRRIELEKAESVIEYAVASRACRSVLLQNYFGETAARDCGVCDYCVEKRQQSKQIEYDIRIRQSLYKIMHRGSISLEEIIKTVPELEKDMWMEVIREMLDNEELYYDQAGMLHLTGETQA